ncbi:MAG: LuxR C-terminal-related transcriptional regulator [Tannerella sp.]|jgi:DNA-binding CsgD family transcriptional regulator|nr:LuxR C-terminal-related transcriptional regulator [Tannerella sp.]
MSKPRQIAILLPDTLQSIGLRSLLTDYFSPVEITRFSSFEAFASAEKEVFDFYFILPELFVAHADFFLPIRNKTVCILYRDEAAAANAWPYLPILAPQEVIIGQLRQAMQEENPSGLMESSRELSAREREVLQLIVAGLMNKEIADKLYISLNTVLTHRKNITSKLGIKTVPGLTFYAITNGLISGNEIAL